MADENSLAGIKVDPNYVPEGARVQPIEKMIAAMRLHADLARKRAWPVFMFDSTQDPKQAVIVSGSLSSDHRPRVVLNTRFEKYRDMFEAAFPNPDERSSL